MIKARIEDWTYDELLEEVAKRKFDRMSQENKYVLARDNNCIKIKQPQHPKNKLATQSL